MTAYRAAQIFRNASRLMKSKKPILPEAKHLRDKIVEGEFQILEGILN